MVKSVKKGKEYYYIINSFGRSIVRLRCTGCRISFKEKIETFEVVENTFLLPTFLYGREPYEIGEPFDLGMAIYEPLLCEETGDPELIRAVFDQGYVKWLK
jgi:hypothetical protein